MSRYRSVESSGRFGMRPDVELDLGLGDDHKPNRVAGLERKRYSSVNWRGLFLQKSGDQL